MLIWLAIAIASGAPTVVRTFPAVWQVDVDPHLTQIEVEFDTEMSDQSYSVVGGGRHFPRDGGSESHWLPDRRTFVLSVSLSPDRLYSVHFNAGPFDGFRSVRGEVAAEYHLMFVTAAGSSTQRQREKNDRSIGLIAEAISEQYAHLELLPEGWNQNWLGAKSEFASTGSSRALAVAVSRFFSNTCDDHLYWTYRTETYSASSLCNISFSGASRTGGLQQYLSPDVEFVRDSRSVAHGNLEGSFVVRIEEWDQAAVAAEALISRLPKNDSVIIDVRGNVGGSELIAQRVAGCFAGSAATYARGVVREDGAWSERFDRTVSPNPTCSHMGRVVVLQDGQCRSACESFLLMMRAVGATLVGERSAGSSGRPVAVRVGQGIRMYVPSWRDFDLEGVEIERNGVLPDVLVQGFSGTVDLALSAAKEIF